MFYELVRANRSYRGFDPARQVTREELISFVEHARLCASSMNKQPLKYRLVHDADEVAQVVQNTAWAGALADLHLPFAGTAPTACIVICHDTDIAPLAPTFYKDVGIVAQTMLLAATEVGLGGCMIGNFSCEKIMEILHLSQNHLPQLVLAIGKPAENIVLVDVENNQNTTYYRDAENTHYVPKRTLENCIL